MHPQAAESGLSPRARGTLLGAAAELCDVGIIPAGAGSSSSLEDIAPKYHGSSPQARGALEVPAGERLNLRIIPAGAGSSSCRRSRQPSTPDHPRRRGELSACRPFLRCIFGSSPQARGARGSTRWGRAATRIIPAGAGSSYEQGYIAYGLTDHPRRRGEL